MVEINTVTVKRRSNYYRIPNWIPLKYAFHGWKRDWCVHVNVTPANHSNKPCQSESLDATSSENVNTGSDVAVSPKPENQMRCKFEVNTEDKALKRVREGSPQTIQTCVNIEERNKKKCCANGTDEAKLKEECSHGDVRKGMDKGGSASPTIETSRMSVSEAGSVTGIITRYFPDSDEVKSFNGRESSDDSSGSYHNSPHKGKNYNTPPLGGGARRIPGASKKGSDVGKRVLQAATGLRHSASKTKSPISLCLSKCSKKSCSLDKSLVVFEVSDSVG